MSATTIGHLALFNQHLQKTNRLVEWIYSDDGEAFGGSACAAAAGMGVGPNPGMLMRGTKTTPVWHVKVIVDGVFYGKGRGNTKKAARNEAAKEGLEKMGIFVW